MSQAKVKAPPSTRPERRVESGEAGEERRSMAGSKQSGLWDDGEQVSEVADLSVQGGVALTESRDLDQH